MLRERGLLGKGDKRNNEVVSVTKGEKSVLILARLVEEADTVSSEEIEREIAKELARTRWVQKIAIVIVTKST